MKIYSILSMLVMVVAAGGSVSCGSSLAFGIKRDSSTSNPKSLNLILYHPTTGIPTVSVVGHNILMNLPSSPAEKVRIVASSTVCDQNRILRDIVYAPRGSDRSFFLSLEGLPSSEYVVVISVEELVSAGWRRTTRESVSVTVTQPSNRRTDTSSPVKRVIVETAPVGVSGYGVNSVVSPPAEVDAVRDWMESWYLKPRSMILEAVIFTPYSDQWDFWEVPAEQRSRRHEEFAVERASDLKHQLTEILTLLEQRGAKVEDRTPQRSDGKDPRDRRVELQIRYREDVKTQAALENFNFACH